MPSSRLFVWGLAGISFPARFYPDPKAHRSDFLSCLDDPATKPDKSFSFLLFPVWCLDANPGKAWQPNWLAELAPFQQKNKTSSTLGRPRRRRDANVSGGNSRRPSRRSPRSPSGTRTPAKDYSRSIHVGGLGVTIKPAIGTI